MMQPASPLSIGSLTQLTLSLIAVVALIVGLSWALKRLRFGAAKGSGTIAVLEELALGPRERIVLVRVGDSQVLLGVAPGSVVSLTPLAAPLAVAGPAGGPAFADRLRELMKKRPGGQP
jgi:flagellar protein FliO/FliZ